MSENPRIVRLREQCEGREAVYVEKGALRVRVTSVRAKYDHIVADVEEIPTRGLPLAWPNAVDRGESRPPSWQISSDFGRGSFSDLRWSSAPYVGWTLYFSAAVIQGVVDIASKWPEDLPLRVRYRELSSFILGGASSPER